MGKYKVSFFYGTDRRDEEIVSGFTEVAALAKALEKLAQKSGDERWVTQRPFRIEIEAA